LTLTQSSTFPLREEAARSSVRAFAGKIQRQESLRGFGVDMEKSQTAILAMTQFIEMA
jgi:hypothetical protein